MATFLSFTDLAEYFRHCGCFDRGKDVINNLKQPKVFLTAEAMFGRYKVKVFMIKARLVGEFVQRHLTSTCFGRLWVR